MILIARSLVFVVLISTSAQASILQCVSGKASEEDISSKTSTPIKFDKTIVTIELDSKNIKGKRVSCIDGDFIYDLTPCAPNGFYSLSRGTGVPEIVEYTASDRVALSRTAGYTLFRADKSSIYFGGGFNSTETRAFRVDRLTGSGTLRLWSYKAAKKETVV